MEKKVKSWHPQQEQILKMWGEAAACYRFMHFKAYLLYKKMSLRFTLPIIIISTVTGTANFAQGTFPSIAQPYVPSVIGAFNLFAAIITTVMQFLKINELMEGFRVSSMQYGKLSRNIRLELSLPLHERSSDGADIVEISRAEFDRLIEQSPCIPGSILRDFEREFPGDVGFTKPEITIIKPIDAYRVLDHVTPPISVLKKGSVADEMNTLRNRGLVSSRAALMDEIAAIRNPPTTITFGTVNEDILAEVLPR